MRVTHGITARAAALASAIVMAGAITVAQERSTVSRLAGVTARASGLSSSTTEATGPAGTILSFEENRGQTDPRVRFLARRGGRTVLLTEREAIFAAGRPGSRTLAMRFAGAGRASIAGVAPLPGRVYYAAPGSTGPLSGAPRFERVHYAGLYRGVDLEYYGRDRQLEFDFTVAPHGNPRQIRLSFAGADRVALTREGALRIESGSDAIVLRRPVVYQERHGRREPVDGAYLLAGRDRHGVRFRIGAYDPSLPLVIDPTIVFATYSGRDGDERIVSTEVDPAGNTYLFGSATALPTIPSGPSDPAATVGIEPGATNPLYPPLYCFVQKLGPDGVGEPYEVYFEGFRTCEAFATGPGGAVHLAMQAPYSFNGFVQLLTLTDDGTGRFLGVSVTNLNGGAMGSIPGRPSVVTDMKADASGNVYVLYQQLVQADSALQSRLMKVDASGDIVGAPLDIGAFSPGPGVGDTSVGLAIDDTGQVFVAGNTNLGFPTTPNAFQQPPAQFTCPQDGFLMQIDTTVSPFNPVYASVVGGTDCDTMLGIARDRNGFIYLTGSTLSYDFPVGPSPFLGFPNLAEGIGDGFVVKLDLSQPPAEQLVASTFFGMPVYGPTGIYRVPTHPLVVYPSGEVAVTGLTDPASFQPLNPLFDATASGAPVLPFVEVFSADESQLLFATNLDTTGEAVHASIAANPAPALYVTTETTEHERATVGQLAPGGGLDLLLSKLDLSDILQPDRPPIISPLNHFIVNATSLNGVSGLFIGTAISDPDNDPLTVTFTGPSGPVSPPANGGFYGATFDFPIGTSTVTVTADDGRGGVSSATTDVTVIGAVTTQSGTVTVSWPPSVPGFYQDTIFDPAFLPAVQLTIQNATGTGVTTLDIRAGASPDPPNGYQFGSPPYTYYLWSTVPAGGPYSVCIDTTGMSFADPGRRMFFHEAGALAWTDVTTSAAGSQLCGTSAVPGFYAVLTPASAANAQTTVAGSGYGAGSIDGPGGDPRDDIVDGGQATDSVLELGLGSLAVDAAHGLLYTTTVAGIRRIDLNTGVLDTIGGDGILGDFVVDPADGSYGILTADNVDARQTHITNPNQLALDPGGNIYIAEYCRVRRIDRVTNIITTIAGDGYCRHRGDGGAAVDASLNSTFALAFDPAGNLLVGETSQLGAEIRRIDTAGVITTVAFNGSSAIVPGAALQSGIQVIRRLAVAPTGDIYIAGYTNELLRLDPGADHILTGGDPGEQISVVNSCALTSCPDSPFGGDDGPVSGARFGPIDTIAVEPNGDLLVGDLDYRVRRIAAGADHVVTGADDEVISTIAGYNASRLHAGAAFDANGESFALSSPVFQVGDVLVDPRGGFFYSDDIADKLRHVGAAGGGAADLSITASASSNPIAAGGTLVYDLTVTNNGPSDATNVAVSIPITNGMAWAGASAPGLCQGPASGDPGTVVCGLTGSAGAPPAIAVGQQVQLTVSVVARAAGTLNATIGVSGQPVDPDQTNNTAAVSVQVAHLSSVVTVTSSAAPSALTGQPVTFTATVSPTAPAPNVPPPAGTVAFMDGTTVLGQVALSAGSASFTTSALAAGTHAIEAAYAGDGTFLPGAAALTQVVAAPFVQLVTAAGFVRNAAGEYVAQLTVKNAGNTAAAGVQVTAALLDGVAGAPGALVVGAIPAGGTAQFSETFPAGVGLAGPANVLRTTITWSGGSPLTTSTRVTLP